MNFRDYIIIFLSPLLCLLASNYLRWGSSPIYFGDCTFALFAYLLGLLGNIPDWPTFMFAGVVMFWRQGKGINHLMSLVRFRMMDYVKANA